ncbi:hypothetical protein [Flavobacterium sp.]|jgi:hypothetical protein|uniref:hypothetical protein n=1 Tax=Flavobacterium sp. TaxID=239 RepID=UPI0037BE3216
MECKLVKIDALSGNETSVYTLYIEDEKKTLFDLFLLENKNSHIEEVNDIVKRIQSIGNVGAKEHFFKINEGNLGDGVCALYDSPNSNLRLYCIRYGTQIVLLGNGGYKPKTIKSLQEDEKLTEENYLLRKLSKEITQKLKEKDITIINEGKDFEGDLTFDLS